MNFPPPVASAQVTSPYSWYQRNPSPNPGQLQGFLMAEDPARHEIVLFGGGVPVLDPAGHWVDTTISTDTWVWDEASATWSKRQPATSPPQSFRPAAMAYDGRDIVAYGAVWSSRYVESVACDQTHYASWLWNGATWRQTDAQGPRIAYGGAQFAYDPRNEDAVLFGGRTCNSSNNPDVLDDTWIWDPNSESWSKKSFACDPAAPPCRPPGTFNGAMSFDGGNVVMYGGDVRLRVPTDATTWVWDGTRWSSYKPAVAPPVLAYSAMAYDVSIGEAVLFGGVDIPSSYAIDHGETWAWNGVLHSWSLLTSPVSPPPREGAGMAPTSLTKGIVLYGGGQGTEVRHSSLTDTWTSGPLPSPTTTRLTSSINPSTVTAPVTFTATVARVLGSQVPGGNVTFLDGTAAIGSAPLGAGGTASVATTSLTAGTHLITAAYGGDISDLPSVSLPLTQTVVVASVDKRGPPAIQGVTPTCLPTSVPTVMTITGTGLQGAVVSFPGMTALDAAASASGLTVSVTVPPHAGGPVQLTVSTPQGTASVYLNYSDNCFVVPPTLGEERLLSLSATVGGSSPFVAGGFASKVGAAALPPASSTTASPPGGQVSQVPVSAPVVQPMSISSPGMVAERAKEKTPEAASEHVHAMVRRRSDGFDGVMAAVAWSSAGAYAMLTMWCARRRARYACSCPQLA